MGVGLGLCLVLGSFAHAAAPKAQVLWSQNRKFRIPVTVPPDTRNLVKELFLWVSDDSGYTWKKSTSARPDSPEFSFRAPRDGEYWFAVQTLDVNGKYYPNGDMPAEPTLKVIVDSVAPTIVLEAQGRRGSTVGVRWDVQDEHLMLNTMTIEYQSEGARDWRNVPLSRADIAYIGAKTWDAGTADPVHVRMTIADRAGNKRSVEELVPDGIAAEPGPPGPNTRSSAPPVTPISARPAPSPSAGSDADPFGPVETPPGPPPRGAGRSAPADDFDLPSPGARPAPDTDPDFDTPSAPQAAPSARQQATSGPTLLVGSPRFPLKYQVEDAGPDGPNLVELWITRDGGRSWSRLPEDADRTSPYNVDLGGEGTFGLWLVVQSASGLGDPPPAPNDRPQSWVEVDSAPPSVTMDRPRVGTGANAGKVILSWRASDAHLATRPVTLFYREERADAQWTPLPGVEPQEASGRLVWIVPPTLSPKFHVKAEAVDTLGNRGSADSLDSGPILVDRARPRGRILGLDQANGTSRQ